MEWTFDDTSANVDSSISSYKNVFNFTIYTAGSPKSDPYDSSDGGAYLDGQGHLICPAITTSNMAFVLSNKVIPFSTTAPKSFEAWVYNRDLSYTTGSPFCIDGTYSDTTNPTTWGYSHSKFDSIVWSENYAQRWQMGSEGGARNVNFGGPFETNDESYVHLVLVYDSDGTIRMYHNGTQYGTSVSTTVKDFPANDARVMWCQRHYSAGGGSNPFNITYTAFYDFALSEDEVVDLYCNKFIESGESKQYKSDRPLLCSGNTNSPTTIPSTNPTQIPSERPTGVPTSDPTRDPTGELTMFNFSF